MLTVHQAKPADFNFIYREIIRAAEKKHFLLDTNNPEECDFLKRNLKSILKYGQLENGLHGQPLLFQAQEKNIGFALVSEIRPGHGGNEIQFFFVHHQYRGQGLGSAMLDALNHRWHQTDLYARCFPASQNMHRMLLRRGFVVTHTNSEGAIVLLREKIKL